MELIIHEVMPLLEVLVQSISSFEGHSLNWPFHDDDLFDGFNSLDVLVYHLNQLQYPSLGHSTP